MMKNVAEYRARGKERIGLRCRSPKRLEPSRTLDAEVFVEDIAAAIGLAGSADGLFHRPHRAVGEEEVGGILIAVPPADQAPLQCAIQVSIATGRPAG